MNENTWDDICRMIKKMHIIINTICSGLWELLYMHYYIFWFSCLVVSESLPPHGLQHARLPCLSLSPGVCWNSCPLSQLCYQTRFLSSAVPFSFGLQSLPASGSFPMNQLFISGGQNIGASASPSVLPMNIQGWFPLGLTGLILLSKGLSRVFSSTKVWKHQFFHALPSLWSNSHICIWLLEKP